MIGGAERVEHPADHAAEHEQVADVRLRSHRERIAFAEHHGDAAEGDDDEPDDRARRPDAIASPPQQHRDER